MPSISPVLRWVALGLIGALAVQQIGSLLELFRTPVRGPDYVVALEYVAARRAPDEAVLTALPPPAYLALGGSEGVVFVASPLDRSRAQRYTRVLDSGRYVDFWLGGDAIVGTAGLCSSIAANPNLWLVVDLARLGGQSAFAGEMASVMVGLTEEVYRGPGNVVVRRPIPALALDPAMAAVCAGLLGSDWASSAPS